MPDVIVAGAGVTGLSTAYHLARGGRHRVVVIDKIPVDRRHNAKIDYPALLAKL